MPGLHIDITGDNTNFMRRLQEAQDAVRKTSKQIEQDGGSIENLFGRFTKAAAAFGVGFSAKELVSNIIQVRGEMQQLEVAFTTMLGSEEKANAMMSQLVKTAATTPFDLQSVSNGARQLLAYGTAAEDVNETLVRLGNIAAGLSIPLSELVYLYGTTMTQGRLYTQDLNQFTGRGIPMIRELSKELGVAESEIKTMVEAGKIGFPEVQKVIQNLTSEGGMFFNLMQEQSKTITGQISNIGDSFSMMLNDIGQANEGVINDALSGVSYLIENYEKVGRTLLEIVGTYGAYRAALMAITAYQMVHNMLLEQAAVSQALAAAAGHKLTQAQAMATARTKLLQSAQAALNNTLLANPYVAVAAVVAGLGLAVYKLATYQTEAEKAQAKLNDAFNTFRESSLSEIRGLAQLKGELSTLREGTEEYNAVKEKIIAGYGKYYDGLEEEINKVGLTEEAYKKLTQAITSSFGARQYQQFKSQQESELDAVMSENLGKIQDRLIDKLGEKAGAKYYAKIRDAILQKSVSISRNNTGGYQIAGLDHDTLEALDKAAGVDGGLFDVTNRAVEGYMANILNAMKLTDSMDKKAREKFGLTSKSTSTSQPATDKLFSAEGKSISQLEEEIGKAQTKLEELKKAFADGSGTQKAVTEQEAYIKSLQDTVLEREKDLKTISEVESRINALKKAQKETVYGSKEYNDLQARINSLETKTPQTKEESRAAESAVNKRREAQEKLDEMMLELQRENEQQKLDLQEEGTAKELAQIQADFERKKAEIEKQARELAELNRKAGVTGTNKNGLTGKQQTQIDLAGTLNEHQKSSRTNDVFQAEREAMNKYLQEYGTYQQKKLAIAEEYAEKIRNAQEEGERLRLEQQQKEAVGQLDVSYLKQSIDWGMVFGEFGGMFSDLIRPALEEAKEYMKTDDFKNMDLASQNELVEAINQMERSLGGAGKLNFKELGNDIEKYRIQALALNEARKEEREAIDKLKEAQEEYERAMSEGSEKEKAAADLQLTNAQENAQRASENVKAQEDAANKSRQAVTDTATTLSANMDNVTRGLQQLSSGGVRGLYDGLISLGKGVGGVMGSISESLENLPIVGWIASIVDVLKDGLSNFLGPLLDNVFSSIGGILDDVLSGNLFKTVGTSVAKGVGGILNTLTFGGLGKLFGNGLSNPDVDKEVEALRTSNEELKGALDRLTEKMDDVSVADAGGVYELQKKNIEDQMENTKKMMNEYGRVIDHGFLGIGGSHSSFYKVDKGMSDADWERISKIVGKDVDDSLDFFNLSSEDMAKVADEATDLYAKIKGLADDGARDAAQFMDDYIGYYIELNELQDNYNEKLTSASFDSIRDNFKSTLLDMENSAEQFADNFEELMKNAVLESMMTSVYDEELKKWYESFAAAMEDGELSTQEQEALRADWQDIVDRATDEWKQWQNLMGWEGTSSTEQSASSKGFETMSQDSADELNGRFTALYEVALRIEQTLSVLSGISSASVETNNLLSEIRNLMISSNGYLEDIAGFQKKIHAMLNRDLPEMRKALGRL